MKIAFSALWFEVFCLEASLRRSQAFSLVRTRCRTLMTTLRLPNSKLPLEEQ